MDTAGLPLTVTWRSAAVDQLALDVTLADAHLEMVAALPPRAERGDRWAAVEIRARSGSDAERFVAALGAGLGVPVAHPRAGPRRLLRAKLLVQGHVPGASLTGKLVLETGRSVAEVYLNVRGVSGELVPKDDAGRAALVSSFALGLGVTAAVTPAVDARPGVALDPDTVLDEMRRGGELERWAASASEELVVRLRAAMDQERASPPARHSFLRLNGAALLWRLGAADAANRLAEGVLDERRSVSRAFLASLLRITALRPSPAHPAGPHDPAPLVAALDTIRSRYARSTDRADVHDRGLAERVRTQLLATR